ncbi:transporter substrate-binding domain-containing protein [Undibacterium sp. TS12]|uniref:substrate-binding periplasmic protein n=1 Tax=Undibacterium sp. TS12 TaxID=2908202 RepID=UPI001F4D0F1F|nr:transporter substrate-binding domain-containing protein [Undibacterium sp. TS12]MCH8619222.1 transporter substrate-binding domain-containing protein [Undibacterium sp. TS12]
MTTHAIQLLKYCLYSGLLTASTLLQAQNLPTCPSRPIILALQELGQFYRNGAGLDKDMADEFAKRSGCKFETPVLPRARTWQEIEAGRVDMTLSAIKTAERAEKFWFFPYLQARLVLIIHKDKAVNLHSQEDFLNRTDLRLGAVRSTKQGYNEKFVQKLRQLGRVVDVNDSERLYAMLEARRFDAVISLQLIYGAYLDPAQMENKYAVIDWSPADLKGHAQLVITKKNFSETEAQRWNQLMQGMIKDGSMLQILKKYVSKAEAEKMLE